LVGHNADFDPGVLLRSAREMERMTDTNQPDLVDEHFRPFVRALGNLVITFALCEARLLEFVSEMLGGDELKAVALLKSPSAKKDVLCLAKTIGLSGFNREDLLEKVESFWEDKAVRNRLVHDEWFPSLFEPNAVATRGLTRAKTPEEVFGTPDVDEVWRLALRFQDYDGFFSHRAWEIRRERADIV
jgi:hypothetical protein